MQSLYLVDEFLQFVEKLLGALYWGMLEKISVYENIECLDVWWDLIENSF